MSFTTVHLHAMYNCVSSVDCLYVSLHRSGSAELVLRWMYCLLVIHGRFISSEKPKKLISNLEKVLFLVTTYQYYLFVSVIGSVDHSKHNPSNKREVILSRYVARYVKMMTKLVLYFWDVSKYTPSVLK
jgi:hypothetical protein